jgi:hypothetical protein
MQIGSQRGAIDADMFAQFSSIKPFVYCIAQKYNILIVLSNKNKYILLVAVIIFPEL